MKNLFRIIQQVLGLRPIAANADMRPTALAANAKTIDPEDGEWFQVAPFGTSKFSPDAGKTWLGQIFAEEDAAAMVEAFNSVLGRLGRMFKGLPIYEGHPDVQPGVYPTGRRLGKIMELETREDGLYAKPAWNALGLENVAEGYWMFPSPAWYYERPGKGQKSFHPVELKSVGLTNSPNIREVQPVAKNSDDTTETTDTDTDMKLKPETMALLGLTEEREYTPEEIEAAIVAKAEMAANADAEKAAKDEAETAKATAEADKLKAEEEKATAMNAATAAAQAQAEAEQARDTAINAMLDQAVTAGTLSKAEADAARGKDLEVASNAIAGATAAKAALNKREITIGDRKVPIHEERGRRQTVLEAVNARMEAAKEDYDTAFNAVRRDPKFADLFLAMKKPGEATE